MSKIMISTIISNDLGPIMRMMPIAKLLRDSGHEVMFCNRAWAPSKVIEENGFKNYPIAPNRQPEIWPDEITPEIWNGSQGMSTEGFLDLAYIRDLVGTYIQLFDEVRPDLVVDTWNQASCIAARFKKIPLVTINQADLHPQGNGLIWWKNPPENLPDPMPVINKLLLELELEPITKKPEELLVGDLDLVVGIPETDPLPASADVHYVGSLQEVSKSGELPEKVLKLTSNKPLIWVYPGNPRYGDEPFVADSIVILRAAVSELGKMDLNVVLSTGHQPMPKEISNLPDNFIYEPFVPGFAMAERAELFIHHGGHGSTLTGLAAGTPAIIIPTYSERESNARRVVKLGAGEMVLPYEDENHEKYISLDEFNNKVTQVLENDSYRRKAREVAEKMKQYGGPSLAVKLIEDFIQAV
jgi:UDP:flavonoid glycosyltransferase YjiC (YdhE family)